MSGLRRKGSKFKDLLKKGDEVWVKKMGSVSSLKEQFQKGVIDEVPEGRRSAYVMLGSGIRLHRSLDSLRRRYPENNRVPTNEEIEDNLLADVDESLVPAGLVSENKGSASTGTLATEQRISPEEDTQTQNEEKENGHVRQSRRVREQKSRKRGRLRVEIEDRVDETQQEAMPKRRRVRFSREEPEEIEASDAVDLNVQNEPEESGPPSTGRLPDKDVYIVKDRKNGELYLTLKDFDGKFIMLKRQSGKRKRGYLPVWWKWKSKKKKNHAERSQKEAPGTDWQLWKCSPEAVEVLENRGSVLSEGFRLLPEEDQNFLKLLGDRMD